MFISVNNLAERGVSDEFRTKAGAIIMSARRSGAKQGKIKGPSEGLRDVAD
jgi:hypothetical protein